MDARFRGAIMVTCIKWLAIRDYGESQMLFFRTAAGVVLLAPAMIGGGRAVWETKRPWAMARRCIGSAVGVMLAFYAFGNMPLATAQSLSFARSLFVVLLAMLLLGETVGPGAAAPSPSASSALSSCCAPPTCASTCPRSPRSPPPCCSPTRSSP